MRQTKRKFFEELKKQVVHYSLNSERTVGEFAWDLGVDYPNLRQWHAKYRKGKIYLFW